MKVVTSAYLLHNTGNADIVQGKFEHISGTPVITEKLFDLEFEISPKLFPNKYTRSRRALSCHRGDDSDKKSCCI